MIAFQDRFLQRERLTNHFVQLQSQCPMKCLPVFTKPGLCGLAHFHFFQSSLRTRQRELKRVKRSPQHGLIGRFSRRLAAHDSTEPAERSPRHFHTVMERQHRHRPLPGSRPLLHRVHLHSAAAAGTGRRTILHRRAHFHWQ